MSTQTHSLYQDLLFYRVCVIVQFVLRPCVLVSHVDFLFSGMIVTTTVYVVCVIVWFVLGP